MDDARGRDGGFTDGYDAPHDSVLGDTAPRDSAPGNTAPGKTVPHDSALGDTAPQSPDGGEDGPRAPGLVRAIAVYTGIRVGLIVGITVILMLIGHPLFGLPLIVALIFAVILQLPLSVLFFRRARSDLTSALARAKAHRTAERDRLRAELMGEGPPE